MSTQKEAGVTPTEPRISQTPQTRYHLAPNVNPALFNQEIPQGYHRVADYSEHYNREQPAQVQSQPQQSSQIAGGQVQNSSEDIVARLAEVMKEQFDLKPKEQNFMYRRPYPEWMEQVALPHRYKLPEFGKFSGQDNVSTVEHISRYLAQLGEASAQDALKVRLFPLSLSGSAFSWFTSLPAGSVRNWADLEIG